MAARQSFSPEAWGGSPRAEAAELAGRIVAREVGWPNGNFLPDDLMEIILYCPAGDGAEGMATLFELQKHTNRRWHFAFARTFGEFIDRNRATSGDGATVQVPTRANR